MIKNIMEIVEKENPNKERLGDIRTTVQASALGDYFGVGFREPMERLAQDLGLIEPSPIFPDMQNAMDLGNAMEDAVLDYWQARLETPIYERNINTKTSLDGKLRVRKDGHMIYNGDEEVVETKFVNSGNSFINNKGYHFQVYAQIMAERYEGKDISHGRLLGLYQGRPNQIRLTLTDEIEKDIMTMLDIVTEIMKLVKDNYEQNEEYLSLEMINAMFPWELVEKYSGADLRDSEEYDETDDELLEEYIEIKNIQKDLSKREKELKEYLNDKYKVIETSVLDDGFKFSIRENSRKGAIDMDMLQTDYPDLDFDKYRKEDTKYSVLSIRELKK